MSLSHVLRSLAVPVLAVAFVAGCNGASSGDGNGNGGNGSDMSQFGIVGMDERSTDDGPAEVSGGGGFLDFDADVPADFLSDPYAQVVGTCEVFTVDAEEPIELDVPLPDVDFDFVDAGESLDVDAEGQAEAYATLQRMQIELGGTTVIGYAPPEDDLPLASPLPGDLTLTVPGAEFPAFTDAAFPDVDDFALTSPTDPGAAGSVDVDTTFEWTPGSGAADTVVLIEVSSSDLTESVSCIAADDGSFSFPTETSAELGNDFSGRVTSAARQGIATHVQGDAALILSLSRGEEHGLVVPLEAPER